MAGEDRVQTLLAIGKGLLLASVVTVIGMVALAALVIFAPISDGVLLAANQVLKVASVFLGVRSAVGVGGHRGFALGASVGLCYMVLGYGLYCLLDHGLASPYVIAGEFLMGAVIGAVSGSLIANLRPGKRLMSVRRV